MSKKGKLDKSDQKRAQRTQQRPYRALISILTVTCALKFTKSTQTRDGTEIPLFAVLSQPAPKSLSIQYPSPSTSYSFIPLSTVDWLSSGGALPILLPFDSPIKTFNHILDNVQGVIIYGASTPLYSDTGIATLFQKRVDLVLEHAKQRNEDLGNYFPVFGLGTGLHAIVLSLSNGKSELLQCGLADFDSSLKMTQTPEFMANRFLKKLNQSRMDKVFAMEGLYFNHDCGFDPKKLSKNQDFQSKALILTTSKTTQNASFVSSIEHKWLPVFAAQFNPEKNQFETMEGNVNRAPEVLKFVSDLSLQMVEGTRDFARRVDDVDNVTLSFASMYWAAQRPPLKTYEQIYLFRRNFFELDDGLDGSRLDESFVVVDGKQMPEGGLNGEVFGEKGQNLGKKEGFDGGVDGGIAKNGGKSMEMASSKNGGTSAQKGGKYDRVEEVMIRRRLRRLLVENEE